MPFSKDHVDEVMVHGAKRECGRLAEKAVPAIDGPFEWVGVPQCACVLHFPAFYVREY